MALLGLKGLFALCGLGGAAVVAIQLGTTNNKEFHIHSYDPAEIQKYYHGDNLKVLDNERSVKYTIEPQDGSQISDDDVLFVDCINCPKR